jgi:hypothetical protein
LDLPGRQAGHGTGCTVGVSDAQQRAARHGG